MVVKVKKSFEKTRLVKNNDKSKKLFYVVKEIHDIMKEFYLIKRTISFSFVRDSTFDRATTFTRTFDRARTFTRTFDRGVVRRQNNGLNFCRRIFHIAAGKSGLCMNFS